MESQFLCNNSRTMPILYKLIESHSFTKSSNLHLDRVQQFWVGRLKSQDNNMGEIDVFDSQNLFSIQN